MRLKESQKLEKRGEELQWIFQCAAIIDPLLTHTNSHELITHAGIQLASAFIGPSHLLFQNHPMSGI
jgi:hypothetical protein